MQAPTEQDVLYFVWFLPKVPPGEGVNERVADRKDYTALPLEYRQQLSNFWAARFRITQKELPAELCDAFGEHSDWLTVEHLFQACKIALASVQAARTFSLDSHTLLSQKPGLAARNQRMMVKLDARQLKRWEAIRDQVLLAGLRAKFTQNPELTATLLSTREAALTHSIGREPFNADKMRQHALELVRSELRLSLNNH